MNKILPYMVPQGPQNRITEEYVSSPPAIVIIDERGNHWTLGTEYVRPGQGAPCGEFAFNVLMSGLETGEYASRIERRRRRIRIFTATGWKNWNGSSFI